MQFIIAILKAYSRITLNTPNTNFNLQRLSMLAFPTPLLYNPIIDHNLQYFPLLVKWPTFPLANYYWYYTQNTNARAVWHFVTRYRSI